MQELGLAPFPFGFIVSLMWIAIFLLLGIVIRGLVPYCRKYLVPACMVGGIISFLFMNFVPLDWLGFFRPSTADMEFLVYHLYNLSFCCFGLTGFGTGSGKAPSKIIKGAVFLGGASAICSAAQIVLGTGTIAGYNLLTGSNLLESGSILASQGFIAGPGQAMAIGAVFEQAGFPGMRGLGLAFAAMGFIAATIFGVPAANWVMRKTGRHVAGAIPEDEQYGIYKDGHEPAAGKLRFMSSNVDSMTFQVCLILLTYGLAFGFVMGIRSTGLFGPRGMGIFWSMLATIVCLPVGLIIRSILNRTSAGHLFDQGCHSRLLNILIDLMALAALAGISIHVVRDWWVLLAVLTLVLGFGSIAALWLVFHKMKEYGPERFLVVLGCATGTVTSGLVLVRMIDPEFKSPIPIEVGVMPLISMGISMPLMPILLPLQFGQVYGGSIVPFVIYNIVFAAAWFIVLKLPFWKMNGKESVF